MKRGAAMIVLATFAGTVSPANVAAPSLVGLRVERVESVAYVAGESRAWPAGAGVVATVVVAGRLTVYGSAGEERAYGTGQGFAAGWEPYRTVNESSERVHTSVTFHAGRE
jgi:hypothetical protein